MTGLVVLDALPQVYRIFSDYLRAWRGLFWMTCRDAAIQFAARYFEENTCLLAT